MRPFFRLMAIPLALAFALPGYCDGTSIKIAGSNLPPTNLDSFVTQAGAYAESIYGDEGTTSKPPLGYFTKASRINNGVMGVNDAGITTGHGSWLPDAGGLDEFEGGSEWDMSGANTGGQNGFAPMDTTPDNHRTKELPGSYAGNVSAYQSSSSSSSYQTPSTSAVSSL